MSEDPASSARLAGAFWDAHTAALGDDQELASFGTVTADAGVAGMRDRLEKAHLLRAVDFRPDHRVLDLGGGAGRIALWLAPRVREVTIVDASAGLLEVARRRAERLGIANVRTVHASALEYAPDGAFDRVLALGVAAHLEDDELPRLAAVCARAAAPGGLVVLKEPVTTDGERRLDERRDASGAVVYRVHFRPRERYPQVFESRFAKLYQRVTLAHPIPWFMGGTERAAGTASSGLGQRLLAAAAPLYERLDPWIGAVEDRVRRGPAAGLLAPVPVVQDLYVFRAPAREVPRAGELSVVVIAYNEEENIDPVTRELWQALERARIDAEVVLVDDGSKDATLERMNRLAAELPRVRVVSHKPNKGIGGALRAGFDAAAGAYLTWIPADGQIAPDSVVDLFRRRREAPMLTTVYRHRADPLYRTVISRSLNLLIRARTGQVAKSGGNYLFERRAWVEHAPREDDTMMISTAFRGNLRAAGEPIVEVEIDCRPRRAGSSKVLNPRTILATLTGLLTTRRP